MKTLLEPSEPELKAMSINNEYQLRDEFNKWIFKEEQPRKYFTPGDMGHEHVGAKFDIPVNDKNRLVLKQDLITTAYAQRYDWKVQQQLLD